MSLHVDRQGSGRDLVLLHGWGFDSRVWNGVLPILRRRFRVHCVDLPGYGGSRAMPARKFDEAVALVADALPEDAIVCGWSLGAQLALALARRSTRVRALALVAATPCFVERPDWDCAMSTAAFEAFAAGVANDAGATLARFIRLAALNGTRGREVIRALEAILREALPAEPHTLAVTLAWLRATDLREEAPRIAAPMVAIHGEADTVTSPAAGRWLSAAVPGARFIGLRGCAHVPFMTHAAEFAAAIESLDA